MKVITFCHNECGKKISCVNLKLDYNEIVKEKKMKNRLKMILKQLSTEAYRTADDLSEKLHISNKTVRNDLKELSGILIPNGAVLISKPKFGYLLEVQDSFLYQSFINDVFKIEFKTFETAEKRIEFILRQLFVNTQNYIRLDDLAEMMFVSKSCVHNDMKDVRKLLKKHHIMIKARPGYGMKTNGNEFDMRACIAECSIMNLKLKDASQKQHETVQIVREIQHVATYLCKEHDVHITEFMFQNLIIHLYIMLQRCKDGCYISIEDNECLAICQLHEYELAKQILAMLEEIFHITFPQSELCYITLHLSIKKEQTAQDLSTMDPIKKSQLFILIQKILMDIKKEFHIDFTEEMRLINSLILHFKTIDLRLTYGMQLRNPLTEMIQHQYPLAFLMSRICNKEIYRQYNCILTDDELAYLCIHFNLALERKLTPLRKLNVLLIHDKDQGNGELLKYYYEEHLSSKIGDITLTRSYEIDYMDTNNIDIVIAAGLKVKSSLPVIQVSDFADKKDICAVNSFLVQHRIKKLHRYLNERTFFSNIHSENMEQILYEMLKNLPVHASTLIQDWSKAATYTGFQHMIIYPYIACNALTYPQVFIGLLEKPIFWMEHKIQIVVLLVTTDQGEEKDYIYLHQLIDSLFLNEHHITNLLKERELSYIYDCLIKNML